MAQSHTVDMVVTAAVIEKDGRYLLCRRPDGKKLGGMWEFPGGKLEQGESPEETLARELKEELCLNAQVLRVMDAIRIDGEWNDLLLLFYFCRVEGEPVALEHSALAYCTAEEALLLDLAPSDRVFVTRNLRALAEPMLWSQSVADI